MTNSRQNDTKSNDTKKESAYASLTGFRRAVPIILAALAVFTGLCFVTQDTGALGRIISNVFLGLFSIGGYFIPGLLLIHAFFYPSDVIKKRALSRAIFSLVLVIAIASITHAITYYGTELAFAPVEFYKNGVQNTGGGFIGGILTFCLVKVLGSVGVIILAVVTFALYVTYFFAAGKTAISRVLLAILDALSDFFTTFKEKRDARAERKKKKKEERETEKRESEQSGLLDDDFFSADNAVKSITISELGISETKDDSVIERRPTLQEKVIHDDAPRGSAGAAPASEPTYTATTHERKRTTLDYGAQAGSDLSTDVDDGYTPRADDIIVDEPRAHTAERSPPYEPEAPTYGSETSAESIFASDFDPFDFKINQELASRPSSKTAPSVSERDGIIEHTAPVSNITEEDVRRARERADFEMKKKAAIEAQRRYREAMAETATSTAPREEAHTETHTSPSPTETPSTEAPKVTEIPTAPQAPRYEAPVYTAPVPPKEPETPATPTAPMATTAPAAPTATTVTTAPTATTSPSSAAVPSTPYTRHTSPGTYRNAAEYAIAGSAVSEEESRGGRTSTPPTFKPYTPPSTDALGGTEEPRRDETMTVHRSMLEPTPVRPEPVYTPTPAPKPEPAPISAPANELSEEDEEEAAARIAAMSTAGTATATGMTFEFDEPTPAPAPAPTPVFEDEEDDDITVGEIPEEELAEEDEEIPPEEQNPDVIKMRSSFTCLDGDPSESSAVAYEADHEVKDDDEADDENDEYSDGDEDEPPFEAPTRIMTPPAPEQKEEAPEEKPKAFKPDYSDYHFPPIELLALPKVEEDAAQQEEMNANADKLVDSLAQFNVRVSIKGIDRGPRITRYEVVPARGVTVNSVTTKFNDIALYLGAEGIRMEAPIPGKSAIGVEIPNKKASTVLLRELIETPEFAEAESKTFSCLGKDVTGKPVFADIAKMPHILVAGATGMGKSVTINSILISLLYKSRPDEVKLILIDPKKVEFNGYNGIPHLLVPVVTDVKQAAGVLMWACEQMEKRYELMEALEVRKLDAYNEKVKLDPTLGEPLPKMIIVIDELNDIMINVRKPAEDLIMSIAQKARAAGIHLIIGTQRPSVDVITGVIKANIPSRLSCKVASYNDSKTILEQAGAERLLDKGDMLYIPAGAPKALRVQGAFVSDNEVAQIMKFLRSQAKGDVYDTQALEDINRATQKCSKNGKGGGDDDDDDGDGSVGLLGDQLFLDAVDIAIKSNKVSTSLLQRKLSIGYGKAAKLIDGMEELGIVSEQNGQKPREVLVTKDEWHEMLARRSLD